MLLFDCIRIHREAIITALSVISFIVLMVIGLKIAISKLVKICHDKYDHIIFWKWSSLLIPLAIVISLVVAFCISDWTKSDAIPGVKYCAGHNIDPTGNVLFYCPICKLLCLTSGRQKVVPGTKCK